MLQLIRSGASRPRTPLRICRAATCCSPNASRRRRLARRRRDAGGPGPHGELGLIGLFDLGQLLMLNGATGELAIERDGRRGYLYFDRGQVVNRSGPGLGIPGAPGLARVRLALRLDGPGPYLPPALGRSCRDARDILRPGPSPGGARRREGVCRGHVDLDPARRRPRSRTGSALREFLGVLLSPLLTCLPVAVVVLNGITGSLERVADPLTKLVIGASALLAAGGGLTHVRLGEYPPRSLARFQARLIGCGAAGFRAVPGCVSPERAVPVSK